MSLVREWANTASAFNTGGDNFFTISWSLEFPPSAAFAKICLTDSWDIKDRGAVGTGIVNIRHRLPDNSGQVIDFPNLISTGSAGDEMQLRKKNREI